MSISSLSMSRIPYILVAAIAALLFVPHGIDDDDDTPGVRFLQMSRGTLVICGGGEISDEVMLQFVEAAGGENARIVVVTTASDTADTDEIEDDVEFFGSLNIEQLTVVHTRSREMANDPEFVQPLIEATGIWFIGGKQESLTDTYLGTIAERKIHDVLHRGGAIGGISAGAAVMSSVMIRNGETEPEMSRGFGFLPGTIVDQHFLARNRQERLMGALAANPGMVGLGIDEGAAVVVHGRRLKVVGDSEVVACISASSGRASRVETMKPGAQADLVALSQAAAKPRRSPLSLRHAIIEASAD
ncbi:MAG: cyanophycinase [Planctomycetaceae bacterium]|nr:cyanophycinase [Planctomycetaceae bacterium]